MIRLTLPAVADAERPYVARLGRRGTPAGGAEAALIDDADGATFAGREGLVSIDGASAEELAGDVVIVDPAGGRVERILRRGSAHNTLLVTERCDQLCLMCSQPPKKTHVDRFALFEGACLLAEPGSLIGVSGGEPTLYKSDLLGMIERVLEERPDIEFHVLTNGQFFEEGDVARLRDPRYARVSWGVPIYAADAALHDRIVGKEGAFARLEDSMATLVRAGARVELRTVLLADNVGALPMLARYVAKRLRFVEVWSIMQLEHIGFARAVGVAVRRPCEGLRPDRSGDRSCDAPRRPGAAVQLPEMHGARGLARSGTSVDLGLEAPLRRRLLDLPRTRPVQRLLRMASHGTGRNRSDAAVRRTKYLIPSLIAAGFGSGDPAQAIYVRSITGPRDDPDRGTLLDVFRQDHTVILADHRSHSSHSSHRSGYGGGGHYSHASHRSSTGGGYYGEGGTAAPVRPIYSPPPTRPDPVAQSQPSPLFSPAERAAPVQAASTTLSGRTKRFAAIVRRVQIALLARELYGGPIDGVVGPKLRAALRKFQQRRSLPVTGTITPQTLDGLMVSSD